jgi:branched-chain amino acid aminotransferase
MPVYHYVNEKITRESEALISVLDLGLLRGYGVFDYVPLYAGRPFHLGSHIDRLQKSAEQVQLDLPMSIEGIEQVVWELIEKNEPIDAGIRLVLTGGFAGKDLLLPEEKSSLILLFHPFTPYHPEYYRKGMRAITTSVLRYLPHIKTTNYMPAIFAMKQAISLNANDALYLNSDDGIIEGTTCNVFFFKNGTLITDNSDHLVKGVTREILLNLAQNHYPIEYRALNVSELSSCDEAFLTSSAKDVMPLVQIDDQKIGNGLPGPVSTHLRSLFHTYIKNYFYNNANLNKVIA